MDTRHLIALLLGVATAIVGALTGHFAELNPIAGVVIGGALGMAIPKPAERSVDSVDKRP
jgi:hypothetical protein